MLPDGAYPKKPIAVYSQGETDVLPQAVFHESPGPSNPAVYESTRAKMAEKHRDHVKTIYTTVSIWNT